MGGKQSSKRLQTEVLSHTTVHTPPRTSEEAMKRICSLNPEPGLVSARL